MEKAQFAILLALIAYIIYLHEFRGYNSNQAPISLRPDTTIQVDTFLPPPVIVQMAAQSVPDPIIIYIDSSKNIVAKEHFDSSLHQSAQLYQDSIEDENLTLYYKSVVDGQLLDYNFDYKLKVPKSITKTVTITKPVPAPNHELRLNLGVGTDFKDLSSVTIGAEFISNKGWSVGYAYDILQQNHNVTVGFPIWQQKRFKN